MILACDGVWDKFSVEDAVKFVDEQLKIAREVSGDEEVFRIRSQFCLLSRTLRWLIKMIGHWPGEYAPLW